MWVLQSILADIVGRWAKTKINKDICRHPTSDCTPTCNILAPTHGAGSHYTNTNTKQASLLTCHLLCSTEQKYTLHIHHHNRTFNKQQLTIIIPGYETNTYTMLHAIQY